MFVLWRVREKTQKRDSDVWIWLFVALFEHTGIVTHIMRDIVVPPSTLFLSRSLCVILYIYIVQPNTICIYTTGTLAIPTTNNRKKKTEKYSWIRKSNSFIDFWYVSHLVLLGFWCIVSVCQCVWVNELVWLGCFFFFF